MKVAIIHYWLTKMRGGEKVLENICDIYPEADIYTHVYNPNKISERLKKHNIYTTFINSLPYSKKKYRYYLPLMPFALKKINLSSYDLIVSSEAGPSKGVNINREAKHVCYCHSPMRYIWDMSSIYYKNFNILEKIGYKLFIDYLKRWDVNSASNIDLIIANCVLKYSQSNNISMAYDGQIIGLGCGQQNRVGCVSLAGEKAMNWMMRHQKEVIDYYKELPSNMKRQEKVNLVYDFIRKNITFLLEIIIRNNISRNYDITMGSDGFFPFPDNIDIANTYGVKYIIQPGGSLADTAVQNACDKFNIKMFNTNIRMFYH